MDLQFDVEKYRSSLPSSQQYGRQLHRLSSAGKDTRCIDHAIAGAIENLREDHRSFVIYGEPQSGKTEMMICLTAKLLDEGYTFVLHLLNDSVDLLGQNLGRFKSSGLAPAARNFSEILDPSVKIKGRAHVVFCKKNANDLRKLLNKIGSLERIVIVDDEADYASPNAKINQGTRTPINALINTLLGDSGAYIGVTATPARLDLNNTFNNDSNRWVNFPPHSKYTGQDHFFPLDKKKLEYQLELLPDKGAEPEHARRAVLSFLINVAYLNLFVNASEKNYSMLVHTSGMKVDHKSDWNTIQRVFAALDDRDSKDFAKYVRALVQISGERYPTTEPDRLVHYVVDYASRNAIIILNSERDWADNATAATNPTSLFTIVVGGNIISRGVTFENLLSMYFTRDVKHKIQQDTYIQRARMFGGRGDYLEFFELTIPKSLYNDWHRSFVLHRLALSAIKSGRGALVWLGDHRIAPAASSSIDKSYVDVERGEMTFPIFDFNPTITTHIEAHTSNLEKVRGLARALGCDAFPEYLLNYIEEVLPHGDASIMLHAPVCIAGRGETTSQDEITTSKGFFGGTQLRVKKSPGSHHLGIFYNAAGRARLVYRFTGTTQFLRNTRHDT